MTKQTARTLLVGDHFRPPAKLVLAHLPAGAKLGLEPEDNNPYDDEAVRVMLDPGQIPESQFPALEEGLPEMGCTLEQLMSGGPLHLGYVPKSGGKPLVTAQGSDPGLIGNHEVREILLSASHQATLSFDPAGKAQIQLTWDDEETRVEGPLPGE